MPYASEGQVHRLFSKGSLALWLPIGFDPEGVPEGDGEEGEGGEYDWGY